MRPLTRLVPLALLLLAGCAGPLPQPDPQMAWVELRSAPANTLLAERLDGERLSDGRYFQVTPGRHVLEVRFQYELYGGSGGGGVASASRCRSTATSRWSMTASRRAGAIAWRCARNCAGRWRY